MGCTQGTRAGRVSSLPRSSVAFYRAAAAAAASRERAAKSVPGVTPARLIGESGAKRCICMCVQSPHRLHRAKGWTCHGVKARNVAASTRAGGWLAHRSNELRFRGTEIDGGRCPSVYRPSPLPDPLPDGSEETSAVVVESR
jgi:hypothetical protein